EFVTKAPNDATTGTNWSHANNASNLEFRFGLTSPALSAGLDIHQDKTDVTHFLQKASNMHCPLLRTVGWCPRPMGNHVENPGPRHAGLRLAVRVPCPQG